MTEENKTEDMQEEYQFNWKVASLPKPIGKIQKNKLEIARLKKTILKQSKVIQTLWDYRKATQNKTKQI